MSESKATKIQLQISPGSGIADEFLVNLVAKDDPNDVQTKRVKYKIFV